MPTHAREFWVRLLIRAAVAVPFAALAAWMFWQALHAPGMLFVYVYVCFGVVGVIGAASVVTPLLTETLGRRVAESLFIPDRELEPAPRYSIPESLTKKGRCEEAIARYREIADEFPDVLKPHTEILDILLNRLDDPDRARAYYEAALARFEDPDRRTRLAESYGALTDKRRQDHERRPGREGENRKRVSLDRHRDTRV